MIIFFSVRLSGSGSDTEKPFAFRVYVQGRDEPYIYATTSQEAQQHWLTQIKQVNNVRTDAD